MRQVIHDYRRAFIAGLIVLVVAPIGSTVNAENPLVAYFSVLLGGLLVTTFIVGPFICSRLRRQRRS